MLDEDAVLQHRDLGAAALAAHDHDPLDRLAPGQELRLGDDRGTAAAQLAALTAALLLGLQPGRSAHALDLVHGGGPGRAGRPDADDGVRRVVGGQIGVLGAPAAATATAAGAGLALGVVLRLLAVVLLGRRGLGLLALALLLLAVLGVPGAGTAAAAAPAAATTAGAALALGVVIAGIDGLLRLLRLGFLVLRRHRLGRGRRRPLHGHRVRIRGLEDRLEQRRRRLEGHRGHGRLLRGQPEGVGHHVQAIAVLVVGLFQVDVLDVERLVVQRLLVGEVEPQRGVDLRLGGAHRPGSFRLRLFRADAAAPPRRGRLLGRHVLHRFGLRRFRLCRFRLCRFGLCRFGLLGRLGLVGPLAAPATPGGRGRLVLRGRRRLRGGRHGLRGGLRGRRWRLRRGRLHWGRHGLRGHRRLLGDRLLRGLGAAAGHPLGLLLRGRLLLRGSRHGLGHGGHGGFRALRHGAAGALRRGGLHGLGHGGRGHGGHRRRQVVGLGRWPGRTARRPAAPGRGYDRRTGRNDLSPGLRRSSVVVSLSRLTAPSVGSLSSMRALSRQPPGTLPRRAKALVSRGPPGFLSAPRRQVLSVSACPVEGERVGGLTGRVERPLRQPGHRSG